MATPIARLLVCWRRFRLAETDASDHALAACRPIGWTAKLRFAVAALALALPLGSALAQDANHAETTKTGAPIGSVAAPAIDPNKPVTLTLGELQALMRAEIAAARAADAAAQAKSAEEKLSSQLMSKDTK